MKDRRHLFLGLVWDLGLVTLSAGAFVGVLVGIGSESVPVRWITGTMFFVSWLLGCVSIFLHQMLQNAENDR